MGLTVAEKIIARAAGRDRVEPGEYVTVTPDYTVGHELFWPMHRRTMEAIGIDRFPKPEKVVLVVDHTPQAAMGTPFHESHREMLEFAQRTGVKNFFGPGRGGLRHFVMVEQGFARPGLFVFSDEPNLANMGVFGTLNIPISWEVQVSMLTDENWIQVPGSVQIHLDGQLPFGVLIRDLVQTLNRDFAATDRMLQKCVEFTGPSIAELSLDNRQALLAGAYHCNAETAVMEVDEAALAYVQERAPGEPCFPDLTTADDDAAYAFTAQYDLSDLEPYVTLPPYQHTIAPAGELHGKKVDQATIGSCASSRLDDLRAAARILRGRRIAEHVTMYVTPGSQEVFTHAAKEGLLEVFSEAGAAVLTPGCNTCWGYVGVLHDGEVSISTHQENYRGRNGSRDAEVFLGSPYVVAAAAVAGEIVDPREMLTDE